MLKVIKIKRGIKVKEEDNIIEFKMYHLNTKVILPSL